MLRKIGLLVLFTILINKPDITLAHDGSLPLGTPDFHIAPGFGDTETIIDYDNGVRGVQHNFYWAEATVL